MTPDPSGSPPGSVGAARATVAAVSVTGLAMFPVWLLGAMAADVQLDLAFGPAALGAAVAVFQAVSAVSSIPAGIVVERVGWRAGSLTTIALFVIATAGIAALARSWLVLVGFLAVAAVASSLSSPTANLSLAKLVPPERQGAAFGLKQAAVPAGTFLAGLAVPLIALTIGWRWAFGLAAVAALPLAFTIPREVTRPDRKRPQLRGRPELLRPLVLLAAAGGLGTAATNSMAVFYVVSAIDGGIPAGTAGTVLAAGGAVSVLSRVIAGRRADRRGRQHFVVVAVMMAVGATGVAALGFTSRTGPLVVATVVAYGLGWSWNGLFDFALVRRMSETPATATGVAQTGKYLGGVVGPWAFGVTVELAGYRPAWIAAGVVLIIAAGMIVLGRMQLRRALAR